MRPREDPEVKAWLAIVDEDRRVAALAVDQEPPLVGPACFHAQQAAEKALKAMVVALDLPVPGTHDLVALVRLVETRIPEVVSLREAAALVSTYGVSSRYPVLHPAASAAEAREANAQSESIVAWVLAVLT